MHDLKEKLRDEIYRFALAFDLDGKTVEELIEDLLKDPNPQEILNQWMLDGAIKESDPWHSVDISNGPIMTSGSVMVGVTGSWTWPSNGNVTPWTTGIQSSNLNGLSK